MRKIAPSDIRAAADYEAGRDEFRKRLLAIKADRRVTVGENLTLLFENRDTMIYQVHEMLRVEKITELKAIAHEIETYNELVPGTDELTATLLLEYDDPGVRAKRLRELLGLENHVWLEVAGHDPVAAEFDLRQMGEDRISSVHYIRFAVGAERAAAIRSGAALAVKIDHPHLSERAALSTAQSAALAEDLAAD
jgi:hypothetical protein